MIGRFFGGPLALLFAAGLLATGCPPHERTIRITGDGVMTLLIDCPGPGECESDECCAAEGCCEACCSIAAGTVPNPADQRTELVEVRLMLLEQGEALAELDPAALRAQGPCMVIPLDCFAGNPGQAVVADCIALLLNEVIARDMPEGLGYDGLEDAGDALLLMSLHNVGETSTGACSPDTLFACVGLEENVAGDHDIACASCQGRSAKPGSQSTADPPCVGDCFIEGCHALLAAVAGG